MRLCYAARGFLYPVKIDFAAGGIGILIVRNLLVLMVAVAVLWLAADRLLREPQSVVQSAAIAPGSSPPVVPLEQPALKHVGDISVHSVEEMELLFSRVEQLLERPRRAGEQPLVSLVLHGPEVEFFALKNYARYKSVVDRAAKLAALGAVDISICQTQMRNYGIAPEQVPSFLRQVPFGPDEVDRLVDQGFVYM
jgi:intracellular sulfur oxidation DsrE/DsrF family protein